ncbi:protein FAR1-RELATED SEQUENCE 5-like [Asparagus officinalis]|uniref:protein FAR1-RELATED SEQUENCE 5-like n=1 Tax=Asparagus officinalis TaxID=4686 RepID=UPI00098E41F3|nr:protein FAR1-RELATED SEQUENCE 5-like [Asparagus officinalis]
MRELHDLQLQALSRQIGESSHRNLAVEQVNTIDSDPKLDETINIDIPPDNNNAGGGPTEDNNAGDGPEFGMEETNSNSVEFGMGESSVIGIETAANSVNAPKPLLGMKFNSHEEAYNYYNSYALLMGFGIRKSSVNYSRKTREVSMTANDPEFYFAIEVDSSGQMRSVFWADGRSRASCLQFSDVIVFDVTYRTNKFGLPFAPFTGVNHHRQSTLLGCALLADEQEDTFVWLFEEWLKCMHGIEPGAIITDQDRAMCNAIHSVFPTTRHRYCYWHMQKHIIDHLPTLVSRYGEQFQRYWGLWCNSSSIEQCEGYWVEMKEKFDINEEGEGWLQTVYKCREHWVPCYLKDTFFAGMRSSQRSESINAFFDGYVNSQTQLHEFVTQYEKAVTHRLSEAHEDFKSLNTKPVMLLGHPIEVQAGEMYTRNMFDVFHTEFKGFGTEFCEELRKDGDIVEYKVCKFTDRGK